MEKWIALDIDGTLFNDNKEITPLTREALMRAQEKGHRLILASGRPASGLSIIGKILEMDKHHGLLLSYNGGTVTDCTTGEILYANTISVTLAKKLLKHLENYPVNPIVDNGQVIYTNNPESFQIPYEAKTNHLNIKKVANISDALDFSPAKILIAAPKEMLEIHTESLSKPFQKDLSFILSAPFYLEATPKGVDKRNTLEIICKKLSIACKDVIAFGDAQNDISMIEFAGTGVAMGNACDALMDKANMITGTNNEDGIAEALKKLGII